MTYPQYPAHPGGVDPAPRASGGTAITAGVLAVLGGLYAIWGSISSFQITSSMSDSVSGAGLTPAQQAQLESFLPDWIDTYGTVTGIVQIPIVLLLLAGAILLFRKAQAGRWMVLGGCVLVIALNITSVFVTSAIAEEFTEAAERAAGVTVSGGITGIATAAGGFVAFLLAVPAIVTLVLVLVRPTARWCGQGQLPAMPSQPGGFGQPPGGFPQSPHPHQVGQQYPYPGQQPPQQW